MHDHQSWSALRAKGSTLVVVVLVSAFAALAAPTTTSARTKALTAAAFPRSSDSSTPCSDRAIAGVGRNDDTSLVREKQLLKDLLAKGWKPTKAGKELLAGKLPAAVPLFAEDGTLVGEEASAQLAQLPLTPATTRTLQGAKRGLGRLPIFMNCGMGQKANVNFAVQGVPPYTSTWVVWNLVNGVTGASRDVRSAGTNYCPANSLCFEYFYLKPVSPWYVFMAWEHTSYLAPPPAHLSAYCAG